MQNKIFTFRISPYETEKLLPQVSRALEKRMELVSRERYPGMWKATDRFRDAAQGRSRSRLRTRVLSVMCLAAGIFLLIPGIMKPGELFIPLLAGAAATLFGILGLWGSRKKKKNPFDTSAQILLKDKDSLAADPALVVSFSGEGMALPAKNSGVENVPYSDFECAVETEDLFLFVYKEQVIVLQKKDLAAEDRHEFCSMLMENITKYAVVSFAEQSQAAE